MDTDTKNVSVSLAEEIRARLRATLSGISAGDLDWLSERATVLAEVFGEVVREHHHRRALEEEHGDLVSQLERARVDAFASEKHLNKLLAERSADAWLLGKRQSEARQQVAERGRAVVQLEAAIRSVEKSMESAT